MEKLRFLNVVCEDIDGVHSALTIATFDLSEVQAAVELLVAISKFNGSARIEYEEYGDE